MRDEVVVFQGNPLQLHRYVDQGVPARDLEDIVSHLLDDAGARVEVLVDPVAEPHQPNLLVLHPLDVGGYVLHVPNLPQHPEHRLVGPAMQRSVECGGCGRRGAVRVDAAGSDGPHRICRAVLLVVGMKDE